MKVATYINRLTKAHAKYEKALEILEKLRAQGIEWLDKTREHKK